MNKIENIKRMRDLAYEAYEDRMAIIPDMQEAAYFKGKFHACQSILKILEVKEVQDRPAGM
jgi:hypothetical protein